MTIVSISLLSLTVELMVNSLTFRSAESQCNIAISALDSVVPIAPIIIKAEVRRIC